ncbi:aminotransferase class V-fold PLP-dependent enzyme [Clostridium sp. Sa3CUN1]|uniref:Aminotransferase class V-fold PLP-dependent enzyme n=1 Tax=Clostridium gallinarum TaxID=2762246 RepID=A0ABR8Q2C9_9CLOT|nr:aminotransferase class V-fold PLP-dependent enzyme [Clostridium gallinarum]MBD7914581.1 aminotransferase class V-fold PLP-dependent enzyme [Clostridium gallinarum]
MDRQIYLDNAATTFPKPEAVYNFIDEFLREKCVNAGRGSYKLAQDATKLIDETRKLILELVNSRKNDKVIFSPSATIAINQILRGLEWSEIKNVYVSPFEHNAIMRTLHSLRKNNEFKINIIPFDNISFELNEEELRIMYSKNEPDLIIMSHVSNVTGYILPIKKCHELAKQYKPINIVDCAQSLGLVEVDIQNEFSECDFIIFAGHKSLYASFGVGGFISLNNDIKLNEVITGGTGSDSTNLEMPFNNEMFFEAGSYNMYAIAGLNAALKWHKNIGCESIYSHEKILTKKLIQGLQEIDGIEIYIPENLENHIGVVSFNLNGYSPQDIGRILSDEHNIAVRTGHHCAPLVGEFLDGYAINGTVRVSIGYFNIEDDINSVIKAIEGM